MSEVNPPTTMLKGLGNLLRARGSCPVLFVFSSNSQRNTFFLMMFRVMKTKDYGS